MYEWQMQIQRIVDEIDSCIKNQNSEALTLGALSAPLAIPTFYTTRKFKEISGMQFRDYLRRRKLTFALKGGAGRLQKAYSTSPLSMGSPPMRRLPGPLRVPTASRPANTAGAPDPWSSVPKSTPLTATFWGLEIGMLKSTEDIKIYCDHSRA